jgi:acyl-homoserine lactone acylase PvdQ
MGEHPLDAGAIKALSNPTRAPRRRTTNRTAQTMELKANSSNNTIFADADGDIAYFHGNFIPRATPASIGPSRWTAALPPRSGKDFWTSTRRRTC